MINNQEFAKRLEKIMEDYDLSASAFANKIEVGRSSISHIISGRNKPSLDFILKILKVFPEIDLYWLMNGKGNYKISKERKSEKRLPPSFVKDEKKAINITKNEIQEKVDFLSDSSKKIEKIILLYNDGSFDSFENSK